MAGLAGMAPVNSTEDLNECLLASKHCQHCVDIEAEVSLTSKALQTLTNQSSPHPCEAGKCCHPHFKLQQGGEVSCSRPYSKCGKSRAGNQRFSFASPFYAGCSVTSK